MPAAGATLRVEAVAPSPRLSLAMTDGFFVSVRSMEGQPVAVQLVEGLAAVDSACSLKALAIVELPAGKTYEVAITPKGSDPRVVIELLPDPVCRGS